MSQYIDKAAVVAEIDELDESNIFLDITDKYNEDYKCGYEDALEKIRTFLYTIKVKEVDIEKESELIANNIMISVQANLYHTNVYDYEKKCYKYSDLKDAARKGIEFGLKAKGG